MRKVTLRPGAPDISELRAELRVRSPYTFDKENWPEEQALDGEYHHGVRPSNLLQAANEELAMLDAGESDIAELIFGVTFHQDNSHELFEFVLVDEAGIVWSQIEETDSDEAHTDQRPLVDDEVAAA